MRFILLILISIFASASEFPQIFSSTGDEIYENMKKYSQIKDLPTYKNRPELLEAYCFDANATMQKGFALDEMSNNPEVVVDKAIIKSYAKELRALDRQNEKIISELDKDVGKMYEEGDFKSLKKISEAGFILSDKMLTGIKENENNELADTVVEVKKSVEKPTEVAITPVQKPVAVAAISTSTAAFTVNKDINEDMPPVPKVKKRQTKLEYYEDSLMHLKEELYALRESTDQENMSCLNDITAINYWMINVLKNENEACARADAIKQMKSYDKAAANSCGRTSMRYIEWHGRIKPYVGKKLFEAEAGCNR